MTFNWVDFIIIVAFFYQAYQGWLTGFVSLGVSLIAFIISLWLAVMFHQRLAGFFTEKFGIAQVWTSLISYTAIVIAGQIVVMQALRRVMSRVPKKIADSKFNGILGAVVSVLNGMTIVVFVLLIILALPLKGTVRKDIRESSIGGAMVRFVERYGGKLNLTMDDFQKKATDFFTIKPDSKESIPLDVAPKSSDLEIDDVDERKLLELVNNEREKAGVPKLTVDVGIVTVARKHSRDMFERRYFGHISPDGKGPADRMMAAEVRFSVVGENLAFAPDVASTHQGLMNSPEHKKNILDPAFHRVGIGIISTDSFGVMVTQDFAN
jgi:uncharacterized protein YkwD